MDTVEISGRKNPAETSGFLSSLFFGWTAPIFRKGARQGLQIKDLYRPLRSDESERLGDRLEREWKKELMKADQELKLGKDENKKPTSKPNLTLALARMFWVPYMIQGVILLIQSAVLRVARPIFEGWVISYFNPDENLMKQDEALLHASLLVITTLGIVFTTHHTGMRVKQIGMCVRVACCSMIYRKVLRLDQIAVNSTAAGQVANLISNDVARFDLVFTFLHYIWIMPIQLSLVGYVMWQSVGTAALVGIVTMIVQTVLIQGYLSRFSSKLRSKIAMKTDRRVQMMSELISGIQIVKMYSWEKPFELVVSKLRALELRLIRYTSYVRAVHQSMMTLSDEVSLYMTLIVFVLMGHSLTANITFVLIGLFGTLKLTCAFFFPQAVILAGESAVSLERLTNFLLLDEVKCPEKFEPENSKAFQDAEKTVTSQLIEHGVGIKLMKIAANWVYGQLPPTLCDVSMEVKSQSLCAVVGSTGSGKSSLLHLLLGELSRGSGKLLLFSGENSKTRITSRDIRISYTSQDSWLFSASVRDNILFGQPYNEVRYQEIANSSDDIEHMSYQSNDTSEHRQEIHFKKSQWIDENGLMHEHLGIYVYTILLFGSIFFAIVRSVLFMNTCTNASHNIHDSMFANLLQAPMRFFNTNPSGRILNRFSKDVGSMDELLPRVMLDALHIFLMIIGVVIMVTIVNFWMIVPAVIIAGVSYIASTWYFKTAQNVMRLEGITKSPVFSHVSSTLDGLGTIRSRGPAAEELLRKKFDHHQDAHTGAWFLTIVTASAFGLFLDLITSSFVGCVCFSFILVKDGDTLPGYVGLAISQSLILTGTIQFGVRQCATVISQMTSVERLLQYTNLPKEGPFTSENPPPSTWPSQGSLVFKDTSMRYAVDKPLVLKNLNLTIHSGWKVGIVGRTGAGKSSLISALFRLAEDGLEGEIVLDGIDTKSIGLHELRPRISIIPQEPILFSASLRYNLDPFEQYSDSELWDSLREVELGDVVTSLDFRVAGGGANFSVGERQLICLARAILRKNRLLVLDEATANIDHSTDALIQTTIRRIFADCTVLTIAHRLNTIMDSDRILVMRDGCVTESGHPHILLKNRDSQFARMLQQSGKAMADKLAAIAENAYQLSPEFREESNDDIVQETDEQITHL